MADDAASAGGGGRRGLPRQAAMGIRLCITVPEAAKMLGISRNFAYQLVREGKIPSIRLGKRILIPKIALEEMLRQGVKFEGSCLQEVAR
jgi:excisionase family DNA binding protein